MQNVVTGTQLLAELSALIAAGADYENPKLVLIKNEEDIPPTAALGDLDLADYTGYATSTAVTWGTPHLDDDGNAVVLCNPKEFKPTADGPACTVHHVGLVDNAGTLLLRTARLSEPITFTTTQDVYMIGFPLTISQPSESPEGIYP